jgi:uncharacterized membrane protein YsdA (DUF1294 family)
LDDIENKYVTSACGQFFSDAMLFVLERADVSSQPSLYHPQTHPYMNLPTLLTLPNALGLFALVNLWTFMLFGFDKIRAEAGSWRVSEGTLLAWAFLGGTIGAYAGRALFRHKTRKQPFSSHLHQTAILQGFAVALVGGWMLAG